MKGAVFHRLVCFPVQAEGIEMEQTHTWLLCPKGPVV